MRERLESENPTPPLLRSFFDHKFGGKRTSLVKLASPNASYCHSLAKLLSACTLTNIYVYTYHVRHMLNLFIPDVPFQYCYQLSSGADFRPSLLLSWSPLISLPFTRWRSFTVLNGTKVTPFLNYWVVFTACVVYSFFFSSHSTEPCMSGGAGALGTFEHVCSTVSQMCPAISTVLLKGEKGSGRDSWIKETFKDEGSCARKIRLADKTEGRLNKLRPGLSYTTQCKTLWSDIKWHFQQFHNCLKQKSVFDAKRIAMKNKK